MNSPHSVSPTDPFRGTDASRDSAHGDRVEHMLTLHRQLPKARTGHEQTALRRQIETTDAQIDRAV